MFLGALADRRREAHHSVGRATRAALCSPDLEELVQHEHGTGSITPGAAVHGVLFRFRGQSAAIVVLHREEGARSEGQALVFAVKFDAQ